jgi:hypothetical protein
MKRNSTYSKDKTNSQFSDKSILLEERSIYIEGVKVLQKQERVSYFVTLITSLLLVVLLFVVLMIA